MDDLRAHDRVTAVTFEKRDKKEGGLTVIYQCTRCEAEALVFDDKNLLCTGCKTIYAFNTSSGCYNWLQQKDQNYHYLKEINLENLPDKAELSENPDVRL